WCCWPRWPEPGVRLRWLSIRKRGSIPNGGVRAAHAPAQVRVPVDRAGLRPLNGAAIFPGLAGLIDGGTPAIGVVGLVRGPGAGRFTRLKGLALVPPDDGFQLGGELGDEMLPVPGQLGLGQDALARFLRQMRPGRDYARSQPANEAFILGRIFELLVFH